ncbi:MAG: hypothetical protein HC788_01575 [Sphingopyxis sp.]|nr:hypothetical protein [Sphingopyxis sp.]
MRTALRHHWKRTGVSTRRVLEAHPPIPDGLTLAIVNDWIANRVHVARPSHWNHVVKLWSALPDCDAYLKRMASRQKGAGRPRDPEGATRIPFTVAMSEEFKAELARTNADMQHDILNVPGAPDGVTQRLLYIWKYHHAKTTRSDQWNFVMSRLRAMPDFESAFSKS